MNPLMLPIASLILFSGCTAIKTAAVPDRDRPDMTMVWPVSYWINALSQTELNILSAEWAAMLEANAYLSTCRILGQTGAQEQKRIIREQNQWLKQCKYGAVTDADEFKGGTMWPMQYSASFGWLMEKRMKWLQKQLEKTRVKSDFATGLGYQTRMSLEWFPSILFLRADQSFWNGELFRDDAGHDWHHWSEFQDMKLQVAYAYLHLNLPGIQWQSVAKENESWPQEKMRWLAQPAASADEKDKRLGRAAAQHFSELEKRFSMLKFSDAAGNGTIQN